MKVVVIGGSGTVGQAVVRKLRERHEVIVGARSSGEVAVDMTSSDSVREMFDAIGSVDAVVCAAGDAAFKPMGELTDDDYAFGFGNKLMGQVNVVRIGHHYLNENGSLTLTSGVTARKPLPGTTSYSMVNGGIESFVRAAAVELAPRVRINAVSPQWIDVTLKMYGMDPAWGVPADVVALGYLESVEGARTGTVIDAGWQYDPAADTLSVGTP